MALRRWLPVIPGGLCALVLYAVLLGGRPFRGPGHGVLTGEELGALLTLVGAWQVWVWVFVARLAVRRDGPPPGPAARRERGRPAGRRAELPYLLLAWLAGGLEWTRASAQDWVGHVGLNAVGMPIILHVGIGRRRPFAPSGTGCA